MLSQTNPSRYGGEAQLAAVTRPEPEFEAIPLSQTNQTTEFGSFEEGEIQSASIPSVEVEQGSTPVTEPDYSQITATMGPVDWQTDLRMEIQDAGRRTNETMGGLLMTGIDRGINAADSIRTTLEAYGDDPSLIWSDVKDIAGSVATRLDDNFNEILFEWSYGSLGDREQYQASTARDIQAFENAVESGIDKVQRIGDAIDRDDFRAVGEELFDPAVAGLVVLGTRGKGLPGPNKPPLGFKDTKAFHTFGDDLYTGLNQAGFDDVQAIFQGSSVTGKSYRTGQPFDAGRVSDFDVALASPALLERASSVGIKLRGQGVRTQPLSLAKNPQLLERLGLANLSRQLGEQAGREVNFMIYRSVDDAISRSPSILVPRN
ncbi:MAG: hypothetical protein AB2765_17185 [Candidatus Thiodiazotropha endolucinida]